MVTGGQVADLTATFVGYKCPIKFSHKKYKKGNYEKVWLTVLVKIYYTGMGVACHRSWAAF